MSYSDVADLIGLPQRRITFGLVVVEYELSNGNSMLIQYGVNSDNEYSVLAKIYK